MAYYIEAYELGTERPYYTHMVAFGHVEEVLRKIRVERSVYHLIKDIKGGELVSNKFGEKFKIVVSEYNEDILNASQVSRMIHKRPKPNHVIAPLCAPVLHGIDKEIDFHAKIIEKYGNSWVKKTRSVTQIEPITEGLQKYGLQVKVTPHIKPNGSIEGWVLEKI